YRIYNLKAENPSRGEPWISSELQRMKGNDPAARARTGPPAPRTVSNRLKEYAALKDDQRLQYLYARWPEVMELGLLPWEASGAILELMAQQHLQPEGFRPTISEAVWFWRLTLAAPKAITPWRYVIASDFALLDSLRRDKPGSYDGFMRVMEEILSYGRLLEL